MTDPPDAAQPRPLSRGALGRRRWAKRLHGLTWGLTNGVSASPLPVAVQTAWDFDPVEEEEDYVLSLDELAPG